MHSSCGRWGLRRKLTARAALLAIGGCNGAPRMRAGCAMLSSSCSCVLLGEDGMGAADHALGCLWLSWCASAMMLHDTACPAGYSAAWLSRGAAQHCVASRLGHAVQKMLGCTGPLLSCKV